MAFRQGRTTFIPAAQAKAQQECKSGFAKILLGLLFVAVPIILFSQELQKFEMVQAFGEAEQVVKFVRDDGSPKAANVDNLVHLTSRSVTPDSVIGDQSFNLALPGALKLRRDVEYCQWMESHTERKDDEGNVQRTYHYYKAWLPHPNPSFLFDQPFNHHNPMRNPFPSSETAVQTARAGAYTLTSPLISSIRGFDKVEFTPRSLESFSTSVARQSERFSYIGDGYFYSAYEPSVTERLLRMSGQYLEGSLLDFQLGDLFNFCTAGDIRVSFSVVAPTEVSVLARQLDASGTLGVYSTSRNYQLALLQSGVKPLHKMFELELSEQQSVLLLARFAFVLWSVGLLTYLYPQFALGWRLCAAVCLSGSLLSAAWIFLWGPLPSYLLSLVASLVGGAAAFRLMPVPVPSAGKAPL